MTKTNKSRQKKRAFISIFLIVAILIGGAFAFLTATDSKTNVFTIGKVDISLWEDFDYNGNGNIEPTEQFQGGVDPAKNNIALENMIPGQTVEKRPYIVNTGNNDCWGFISVKVPTVVTPEDGSAFAIDGNNREDERIQVKAYAIQDGMVTKTDGSAVTAVDVWKAYINDNSNITGFGTPVTDAGINRTKLFSLNGLNDNYTKIYEQLCSETVNGETIYYDCIVYAHNELISAPPADTTEAELAANAKTSTYLFNSVTLLPSLGEPASVDVNLDAFKVSPMELAA